MRGFYISRNSGKRRAQSVLILFLLFVLAAGAISADAADVIRYNGNGASSGQISDQPLTAGEPVTLKKNARSEGSSDIPYVRNGCDFWGWSLSNGIDDDAASIMPGGYVWNPDDDDAVIFYYDDTVPGYTLYARWTNCDLSVPDEPVEESGQEDVVPDSGETDPNGDVDNVAPTAIEGLFYDGTSRYLVNAGIAVEPWVCYYRTIDDEWTTDVPEATYPGTYYVEYKFAKAVPLHDDTGHFVGPIIIAESEEAPVLPVDENAPRARTGLVYDGTMQYLVIPGMAQGEYRYFYRNLYTGEWDLDIPEATEPGTYDVEYILSKNVPDRNKRGTIISGIVIAMPEDVSIPPRAKEGLVYDGSPKKLLEPGIPADNFKYYYRLKNGTDSWRLAVPEAVEAGTYQVEYVLVPSSRLPQSTDVPEVIEVTIAPSEDGSVPPRARTGLVYNGRPQQLLVAGISVDPNKKFYYRMHNGTDPWTTYIPEATEAGTYVVEYIYSAQPADTDEGILITVTIANRTRPGTGGHYEGMLFPFDEDMLLPGTGFPTFTHKPLAIQPADLAYSELSMRIQIPVINVDVEMVGVPETGNSWAVEWLGDRAGLLSGTALPGEGYSMVAAHNHLNNTEAGPFVLLFDLTENDRIFVNTDDGGLKLYSVYANELVEPDDFDKVASIAQQEENTLILVTCENESIEGGYLNRRVVFARQVL